MFDHERLRAYQEALRFSAWAGELIESLPQKISAKDQLDRASTSSVLNIAEGNGKRSRTDRCRYLDTARGSAVECAAALDVLVARRVLEAGKAEEGKQVLLAVASLASGLIARFSGEAHEDAEPYGSGLVENENE